MGQGCKPPLCNDNDLNYAIIVQVNRRMVYEIEDVQMVEAKTERCLDRRLVTYA
jgi:hypothetical protein